MSCKTSSQNTPQNTLVKLMSEISWHVSFTNSNTAEWRSKCRRESISALSEGHSSICFISLSPLDCLNAPECFLAN